MKKSLLVISCFLLTGASFAQCLNEKQNQEVQKRYELVVENLEELREAGRSTDEAEFNKLTAESVKLEKVIEFQEDQCL